MRILNDGKRRLHIRASCMARMFYAQEFDRDLDKDLSLIHTDETYSGETILILIQMVWAMNKAEREARNRPALSFDQWVEQYADFNIVACRRDIMKEICSGLVVRRTYGGDKGGGNSDGNMARKIEAIALKVGISRETLNNMTTQEFVDILHEYVENNGEGSGENDRWGTAAEASAYFGGSI